MNTVLQSLWIGSRLTKMEILSICSYLRNEHEYHLYTYGPVENIPKGVVVKDANEIVFESQIGLFKKIANFSDFFRYNLLIKKGGWWVDTDTVCLKPFDFDSEYVFASEHSAKGSTVITGAFTKALKGSLLMQAAEEYCEKIDVSAIHWDDIGPNLMTQLIMAFKMEEFVMSPDVFNPIPWWHWDDLINPEKEFIFSTHTYAIHLWHEMWLEGGKNPDDNYDSNCLYEQLKSLYL